MPALDAESLQFLRSVPPHLCHICGEKAIKCYCRQCDEFYWICHCPPGHAGHRTYQDEILSFNHNSDPGFSRHGL